MQHSRIRTKIAKLTVAAAIGVAVWAALPGSPVTTVAGSSLNIGTQAASGPMQPDGSSLN